VRPVRASGTSNCQFLGCAVRRYIYKFHRTSIPRSLLFSSSAQAQIPECLFRATPQRTYCKRTTSCTSVLVTMRFASAVLLAFVASAQAAVTSSMVLPTGIPGSSGLPFSTLSFDTTAVSSALSSLSSIVSSESSAVQSVLSSVASTSQVSATSPKATVTSALSSSAIASSAPPASSSSAAGRIDVGNGLGLAAGAAAGLLASLF